MHTEQRRYHKETQNKKDINHAHRMKNILLIDTEKKEFRTGETSVLNSFSYEIIILFLTY